MREVIVHDQLRSVLPDAFRKGVTEYHLIYKQGFPPIFCMHYIAETITLKTLDTLCFILNCSASDIIEYIRMNKGWSTARSLSLFQPRFNYRIFLPA